MKWCHVQDHAKEVAFDYDNRPHRFVDLETAEEVKLNSTHTKSYRKHQQAFLKEMETRCAQYQIDLVSADINEGFQHVLLAYLLKRQKLF